MTRALDRLASRRGLPQVIYSNDSKEFCCEAMVTRTYERDVQLRLIEPRKPNRSTYIGSINGRLSDESLNEHWLPKLLHFHTEIERWQRHNAEGSKKALGGLTPPAYARRLAAKAHIVNLGL